MRAVLGFLMVMLVSLFAGSAVAVYYWQREEGWAILVRDALLLAAAALSIVLMLIILVTGSVWIVQAVI